MSFSYGIVPSNLKIARVIPILKKGQPMSLNNYRPISLLSVFNKPLEKFMYSRLISFLQKKIMLFHKQFGFRSKHSTEHAILCIIDNIQRAVEERKYSCGIFLDFSKAFDTVDHQILILKKTREIWNTRNSKGMVYLLPNQQKTFRFIKQCIIWLTQHHLWHSSRVRVRAFIVFYIY